MQNLLLALGLSCPVKVVLGLEQVARPEFSGCPRSRVIKVEVVARCFHKITFSAKCSTSDNQHTIFDIFKQLHEAKSSGDGSEGPIFNCKILKQKFAILQGCPAHLKARYRHALTTALEAVHTTVQQNDLTKEERRVRKCASEKF